MEAADQLILPAEVIDGISSAATVEELQASMAQAVSALVVWVLSWQTLTFSPLRRRWCPKCWPWDGCVSNCFCGCAKRSGRPRHR